MDKTLCFLLNTKIEVLLDPLMEIIYFLSRKRVNHSPRTSRALTFCANVLFGHLLTIRDIFIYLFIYICFLLCFAIERKRGSPFPERKTCFLGVKSIDCNMPTGAVTSRQTTHWIVALFCLPDFSKVLNFLY